MVGASEIPPHQVVGVYGLMSLAAAIYFGNQRRYAGSTEARLPFVRDCWDKERVWEFFAIWKSFYTEWRTHQELLTAAVPRSETKAVGPKMARRQELR